MSKMPPFHVIYEDNHLLVVNKSAGVLVQGDRTGDDSLVELGKEYIKRKYNKPGNVFLGVVHRIDRPVSGLVVLARTSKALERMNKIFSRREVQKVYWAVVKQKPIKENDHLVNYLVKDHQKNLVTTSRSDNKEAQKAELRYRLLGKLNDHYLLEVYPLTGRPHQIRVQLATMGCPIRGDVKYGFPKPNHNGCINLHARYLKFTHPVKKEPLFFQGGLPNDQFWEQFLGLEDKKIKDKNLEYLYN